MTFIKLETIMAEMGITTLADIARALNTTPQAVSNWKARDQVPYHIVAKLSKISDSNNTVDKPSAYSLPIAEKNAISLSDILLTMAEQLKLLLLVPFITMFITFTYIKFIQPPSYISSAKLLLPENRAVVGGGLTGIASQFGVNVPGGTTADLSSPTLFPELINSRTFAERILNERFYTELHGQELPLLTILTHNRDGLAVNRDVLIKDATDTFQGMVNFSRKGSFSLLSVSAIEPVLARDINIKVLDELQKLNRLFKSRNISERVKFIENRIEFVGIDLENSEQKLKLFREQNRQILSPALQLQEERLTRNVEIQKGIYLTLKQQMELANIERIQKETIVQILDEPPVPLNASDENLMINVLIAGMIGLAIGFSLGFFRAYLNNNDMTERKKLRRVKIFLKRKGNDLLTDRRVTGTVSILLLIGLPYYIGHQSQNPVFFGMYSAKLMFVNIVYVLTFLFSTILFIYRTINKK